MTGAERGADVVRRTEGVFAQEETVQMPNRAVGVKHASHWKRDRLIP